MNDIDALVERLREAATDGPGRDYNVAFMLEAYSSLCRRASTAIETLQREVDRLSETYVDDTGLCWSPPTAEAYYRTCKARDDWQSRANTALRTIERLADK